MYIIKHEKGEESQNLACCERKLKKKKKYYQKLKRVKTSKPCRVLRHVGNMVINKTQKLDYNPKILLLVIIKNNSDEPIHVILHHTNRNKIKEGIKTHCLSLLT